MTSLVIVLVLGAIAAAWAFYLFGFGSAESAETVSEPSVTKQAALGSPAKHKEPSEALKQHAAHVHREAPAPARAAQPDGEPDLSYLRIDLAKIPAKWHPQVRSVMEASRTGTNPERLTPTLAPPPFDPKAFAADPQAYLNVIEPGRVYQSKAFGPGVPLTTPAVPIQQDTVQNKAVPLRVRTAPEAPVTFTSFDGGHFDNHLGSITVMSDKDGIATVNYTATKGITADVNILAASPMAAHQVHLRVMVTVPGPADDHAAAGPVSAVAE